MANTKTKKKINSKHSKRSKRINSKSSGNTSKRKIFRRLQKPTKRKSARLYFRSRKPVEIKQIELQRTIVLSLVASRGKKLELLDPKQVLPFVRKLRSKFTLKNTLRENLYVILYYYMESGTKKRRTVFASSDRPNAATQNNKKIVQNLERFLNEGASKTKTAEKVFLDGITIKRFYPRLKRKVSKTTNTKKKKK